MFCVCSAPPPTHAISLSTCLSLTLSIRVSCWNKFPSCDCSDKSKTYTH